MPPKIRDVLKRLEMDGRLLKSQRGSHRRFAHPDKPGKLTVAGHPSDDPDEATYRSILNQAELKR